MHKLTNNHLQLKMHSSQMLEAIIAIKLCRDKEPKDSSKKAMELSRIAASMHRMEASTIAGIKTTAGSHQIRPSKAQALHHQGLAISSGLGISIKQIFVTGQQNVSGAKLLLIGGMDSAEGVAWLEGQENRGKMHSRSIKEVENEKKDTRVQKANIQLMRLSMIKALPKPKAKAKVNKGKVMMLNKMCQIQQMSNKRTNQARNAKAKEKRTKASLRGKKYLMLMMKKPKMMNQMMCKPSKLIILHKLM